MPETIAVENEKQMAELGVRLAARFSSTDTVLLSGELGAGKTTLVRGILAGLGHVGPVRSPTFNLVQLYPTSPGVMHADLYRVSSVAGIGLEDYLETRLCLIEWPDRLHGLVEPENCWQILIDFSGSGRLVTVTSPG